MIRSAEISECGRYRFRLSREWSTDWPRVAWLMLNPSTADDAQDDPTVRDIVKRAQAWGYGAVDVVNVFPIRTPKPAELWRAIYQRGGPDDPRVSWGALSEFAERNLEHIRAVADGAALRMVGFGADVGERGMYGIRDTLRAAATAFRDGAFCLGTNAAGWPLHPMARGKLRIPATAAPIYWSPAVLQGGAA